jgi:hypothetical protein
MYSVRTTVCVQSESVRETQYDTIPYLYTNSVLVHDAYWNNGGGQHTTSCGVNNMRSPILFPLFKILLWLKHAALGILVVPEVNWMFATSSGCSPWSSNVLSRSPSSMTCSYRLMLLHSDRSTLPAELSTNTTFCSEGISSDSSFEPVKFGIRCVRRDIFDLGSLRGRFVSAPIRRWEAERWLSAERTCGALKAGFSGTYYLQSALCSTTCPRPTYQYSPKFKQRIRSLHHASAFRIPANHQIRRIPSQTRHYCPTTPQLFRPSSRQFFAAHELVDSRRDRAHRTRVACAGGAI